MQLWCILSLRSILQIHIIFDMNENVLKLNIVTAVEVYLLFRGTRPSTILWDLKGNVI